MSDIVKRLQDEATYIKKHGLDQDVDMFDLPAVIMQDAAAEIELLRESRDAVIRKAKERVEELERDRDWWAATAKEYKDDYNALLRGGPSKCIEGGESEV